MGVSFRHSKFLIAASVLVVFSAIAHAQTPPTKPLSVRLGEAVIAIPAPEGFEEVTEQFEKLKTCFRATEPPENDLLGGYLPVSDCELLRRGQNALFTYYAKVGVLRIGREHLISPSYFDANGRLFPKQQ